MLLIYTKERIVLKINLGVHHTTEQLFDTCAHEYVHMVQILIFHALVDEGSITGHGKVFFRVALQVNNIIQGLIPPSFYPRRSLTFWPFLLSVYFL